MLFILTFAVLAALFFEVLSAGAALMYASLAARYAFLRVVNALWRLAFLAVNSDELIAIFKMVMGRDGGNADAWKKVGCCLVYVLEAAGLALCVDQIVE